MASGDRLGGFLLGGSSSASSLRNAALIAGFAEAAWVDGSNYGAGISFETTANGGTTRSEKMRLSNGGNLTVTGNIASANYKRGAGSPEGVVTGIVGDIYTRTDGGAGTTLYVKESGTGNTGWVAK